MPLSGKLLQSLITLTSQKFLINRSCILFPTPEKCVVEESWSPDAVL